MKSTFIDAASVVLLTSFFFASCMSTPLQVVSLDGTCRGSSQIGSFVSSQPISQTGHMCPVLGLIDCSSEGNGGSIFNTVLETSFEANSRGLCLDMSDRAAFLYTAFDSMFSAKFCGSKAADFCGSTSNGLCLLMSAKDVTETLTGYDQIFRRVMKKLQAGASPVQSILFLVKSDSGSADNSDAITNEIKTRMSEIWSDYDGQSLEERIAIEVIMIDTSDVDSLKSARSSILESVMRAADGADSPSALGASFTAAWAEIPSGLPRALLTPGQRQSLLNVEAAYTSGISQIESMVGQWQSRTGEGKIVGKFGERVQLLLDSVRKSYNARTVGTLTVRDRAERARQLDLYLATAVGELFRQQLETLQGATSIKFRKALVKLAASREGLQPEEEQQALRKALFDLRAETADLEVESLGLSSAALHTQVSTALQALLTEFPETAAARLEEVRKVEKNTKRPSKRKGQRAVNIGLNLVGMLRPAGFGNLQGFMGYSTLFAGLPLELLLGVQNDGDSPEIMGEDREYPVLRLQPKMHFDIDI